MNVNDLLNSMHEQLRALAKVLIECESIECAQKALATDMAILGLQDTLADYNLDVMRWPTAEAIGACTNSATSSTQISDVSKASTSTKPAGSDKP